ncbi:hypothetical protein PP175_10140 [Aneurinibacillus sp. Ricciae_BoGa-3]|uniref:hypothetical protein n=1 Tax=Aneurinibacillus sp. Ricciae_BoGa-3 TaxID=3022697 RepID=UPI0023407241|nr:hypothetical protein [Aneurinibacillus sp. Ricciae_BoGa-3]WCK56238.1 hypothetical protein PP175_10140 [Aneurinibacillus sp. Ricciae_BoGa-3]
MDINTIIKIVKEIPLDKLNDEKAIKKAIKAAGKVNGITFSDAELNKYVQQFKGFSNGGSLSLISKLLQSGITMDQWIRLRRKWEINNFRTTQYTV